MVIYAQKYLLQNQNLHKNFTEHVNICQLISMMIRCKKRRKKKEYNVHPTAKCRIDLMHHDDKHLYAYTQFDRHHLGFDAFLSLSK